MSRTRLGHLSELEAEIRRTLGDMTRHARERILRELEGARSHLRGLENHHALKRPERRIREGFQALEHLKRYTTLGMATDQGRSGALLGQALMAAMTGQDIAAVMEALVALREDGRTRAIGPIRAMTSTAIGTPIWWATSSPYPPAWYTDW